MNLPDFRAISAQKFHRRISLVAEAHMSLAPFSDPHRGSGAFRRRPREIHGNFHSWFDTWAFLITYKDRSHLTGPRCGEGKSQFRWIRLRRKLCSGYIRNYRDQKTHAPGAFHGPSMPHGIMMTGMIGTVIGFLLRQDGVPVPRISQIIALLLLPGSLFFLWSPVTDFGLRRKHWFLLAAAIGATALFAAFHVAHLGSRSATVLLLLAAGVCVLTRACDGGLMSSVVAEEQKTRVSGFHNSGVLFAGALGGAGILVLAQH